MTNIVDRLHCESGSRALCGVLEVRLSAFAEWFLYSICNGHTSSQSSGKRKGSKPILSRHVGNGRGVSLVGYLYGMFAFLVRSFIESPFKRPIVFYKAVEKALIIKVVHFGKLRYATLFSLVKKSVVGSLVVIVLLRRNVPTIFGAIITFIVNSIKLQFVGVTVSKRPFHEWLKMPPFLAVGYSPASITFIGRVLGGVTSATHALPSVVQPTVGHSVSTKTHFTPPSAGDLILDNITKVSKKTTTEQKKQQNKGEKAWALIF